MTKERKMGVINSAWGDFMAACNLLMRKRGAKKERGKGREGKEKLGSGRKEIKMKMQIERRALILLLPPARFYRYLF